MTKYRVICADPPWSFEDKLRMRGTVGVRRSAEAHYATMKLADIIALPVGEIAADDAVLAEGIEVPPDHVPWNPCDAYADLWDGLNKERGFGWDVDPWVWVVSFRRLKP